MLNNEQAGAAPRKVSKLAERTRNFERTLLINTYVNNKFNITESAKEMGISRATYYRKLGPDGLQELNQMRNNLYEEASSIIEMPE